MGEYDDHLKNIQKEKEEQKRQREEIRKSEEIAKDLEMAKSGALCYGTSFKKIFKVLNFFKISII